MKRYQVTILVDHEDDAAAHQTANEIAGFLRSQDLGPGVRASDARAVFCWFAGFSKPDPEHDSPTREEAEEAAHEFGWEIESWENDADGAFAGCANVYLTPDDEEELMSERFIERTAANGITASLELS